MSLKWFGSPSHSNFLVVRSHLCGLIFFSALLSLTYGSPFFGFRTLLFLCSRSHSLFSSRWNLCCVSFVGFSIYLFSLDSLGSLMFELFPNELLVCIYLWFGPLRSEAMRWHWFCWSVMIIYLLGSYSFASSWATFMKTIS